MFEAAAVLTGFFKPRAPRGSAAGSDPVAVDATGARIIQEKRNRYFGEAKPIAPSPHHIEIADTRYGLGNSSPKQIELIQLGWQEDSLIA